MSETKIRTRLVVACVISMPSELVGINDIINSVSLYLKDTTVIIFDNSNEDTVAGFLKKRSNAIQNLYMLKAPSNVPIKVASARSGLLMWSLWKCMEYALEHFDFDSFLKIDPDSLIVG